MVDFTKFSAAPPQPTERPDPSQQTPRLEATSRLLGSKPAAAPLPRVNALAGFGASTVSGVGELFGKDPSQYVQRYRAQNPGGALVSQLAGVAVPYIGWELAAAKVIGTGAKGLAVGKNVSKPYRAIADDYAKSLYKGNLGQGFIREAAVFAPLEGARAVSRLVAGDNPGQVAKGAAFDLALGGVFGAGQNAVRAFGQGQKVLNDLGLEQYPHTYDALRAVRGRHLEMEAEWAAVAPEGAPRPEQLVRMEQTIATLETHNLTARPVGRQGNEPVGITPSATTQNRHFIPLSETPLEVTEQLEQLFTIGPTKGNAGVEVLKGPEGLTLFRNNSQGKRIDGTDEFVPLAPAAQAVPERLGIDLPDGLSLPKPDAEPTPALSLFGSGKREIVTGDDSFKVPTGIELTPQEPKLNAKFAVDDLRELKNFAKVFNAKARALPPTESAAWYPSIKTTSRYKTPEEAERQFRALTGQGLRDNADRVQYPTSIKARSAPNATPKTQADRFNQLKAWADQNLGPLGDGKYLRREGNDGMYVVSILDEPNNQMLSFKTDTPSDFLPKVKADATVRDQAFRIYSPKPVLPIGEGVFDRAVAFKAQVHPQTVKQLDEQNILDLYMRRFMGVNPDGALHRTVGAVREAFAPLDFRYTNPRARLTMEAARAASDQGKGQLNRIILGTRAIEGQSFIKNSLKGARFEGNGLQAHFDRLAQKPAEEAAFLKAVEEGLSPDELKALGADDESVGLLQRIDEVDKQLRGELNEVLVATGREPLPILNHHYGFSHQWKDWVVPVYDETGTKIHVVGGDTKEQAETLAEQFLLEARRDGKNFVSPEPATALFGKTNREGFKLTDATSPQAMQRDADNELRKYLTATNIRPASPGEWREMLGYLNSAKNSLRQRRTGVKGFEKPETAAGLLRRFTRRMGEIQQFKAKVSIDEVFHSDMYQLGLENPREAHILAKDLRINAGLDQAIFNWEKSVDNITAPALGKNGALKIARAFNSMLYTGTLSLLNVAYPAVNMLTFAQTTVPHMAWLNKVPAERAQKYYSEIPLESWSKRENYGSLNSLSPLKIAKEGWTMLRQPTKEQSELLLRNILDGHIDNRMLEGYVGQDSVLGDMAREAFGASNPQKLLNMASYMADNSERVSRMHAFAQGVTFGADVLQLQGDDLYRFATKFQRNTMFGYNTVDRSALFRGATGSVLGLFKNWMVHQMAWTAEYAGTIGKGGGSALLTMNAMSGLIGGAGATHLGAFGEGMNKIIGNPDKDLSGQGDSLLTDAYRYGAPAFLGITLQGNAALPGANPVRDVGQMFNFASIAQGQMLMKTAGGGLRHWQLTGEAPWSDKNWTDRLARSTGIKNLYRVRQATGQDGIRSLFTGNPVVTEMGIGDKMLFSLGLNPVELTKAYKANDLVRAAQQTRSDRVAILGRQYLDAKANGDNARMFEIMNLARAAGIPSDSLERSMKRRAKLQSQDVVTRSARSKDVRERFGLTDDTGGTDGRVSRSVIE